MALELAYPHVEKIPGEAARLSRVPRVRVAQIVMDYLAHGWSVDEMCRQHPYLTPAEAHAAMAYYYDHKDEIDREIEADWGQSEQSRLNAGVPAFVMRLKSEGRQ